MFVIVAEKHKKSRGRFGSGMKMVEYYSAALPGWTALAKATQYTDKGQAEKDMRKAGQPHGERGWNKWVKELL